MGLAKNTRAKVHQGVLPPGMLVTIAVLFGDGEACSACDEPLLLLMAVAGPRGDGYARLKDVPGIRSAYKLARSLYHRKSWWLAWPLVRQLRCVQLRRVTVLYPGRARGTPVVRYYWGRFLAKHRDDIRGRVLEIGETSTVRAFGGSQIQQATAIDIAPTSSEVTIVADLARADHVEPDQFDCFVNQFTMHIIDDFKAALYHSIRLLKPAGVLLINFPARSGYDLKGAGRACVYHWFTPAGVEKVLADLGMTKDDYELTTYGNFFSLTAYMAGIPAEELTDSELDYEERDIPLLICAKVVKPVHWPGHLNNQLKGSDQQLSKL